MSHIDFGRHSEDYAAYRPGLPESFYRRLDSLIPIHGSRILDLATGPGTIAIELAARGSMVTGIDISEGQIATANRISTDRKLNHRLRFKISSAESTDLDAGSFDLVTAGQCWHWFDGPKVMREVRRVLRHGGLLAIVHYSYLAEHCAVARETEALVLQFNPSWTMAGSTGVFPEQIDDVIRGGFRLVEAFCYDEDEEFTHARWRGRMRTCNGVGSGGLSPADVRRFDDALRQLLLDKYPEPMRIQHRVWCVVAGKP